MNGMMLLPPAADKCQKCAVDHDPEQPHNQDSLYWKYWFFGQNGRWPTWADAMEHCSPEIKEFWTQALEDRGIDVGKG
ncbi:hypothetical protein GNQ08_20450 [Paenibacillus macerans]|uniref:Uncharacterized protein n=1 Tax=Paenibacillus macerans TaxID=44252 RepID=A0A6N8F2N7_PAEMA|nr:hypothetical protein [Paenibacillus macerans]MUG24742.1 hypothetical protein [Paenibacillus macerans]